MARFRFVLGTAAALIAGLLATSAGAVTNLISNGSFEAGIDPGPYTTVNAGDPDITDWSVTIPNVDYIGSYWQAADGVRSIDLSGFFADGMIQQTISTDPNRYYDLTFSVSANPDQALPNPRLGTVFVAGNPYLISYTLAGNTRAGMNWETRDIQFFSGAGGPTTIQFSGNPNTNLAWGVALDNVSVSLVPEPATWAMLIIGFGMLGFALRRQSRQVGVAT